VWTNPELSAHSLIIGYMTDLKTKRDPLGTRRRILEAATEEFTRAGLSGARVDQIAKKALTNERMLYYYFGSKEQLFTTVLEVAFAAFSDAELAISFDGDTPVEAMTRLMHSIWDFYREHPELLRLVNNENLHEARYLKKSMAVRASMQPILLRLKEILAQGEQAGVFRSQVEPELLFITISALGYYVVSNRYTIETSMGLDFTLGEECDATVRMHTEMMLAYLTRL
jgi:AcrR family transcriptional regulator